MKLLYPQAPTAEHQLNCHPVPNTHIHAYPYIRRVKFISRTSAKIDPISSIPPSPPRRHLHSSPASVFRQNYTNALTRIPEIGFQLCSNNPTVRPKKNPVDALISSRLGWEIDRKKVVLDTSLQAHPSPIAIAQDGTKSGPTICVRQDLLAHACHFRWPKCN